MYGTQTLHRPAILRSVFENDVKMYGTQTEEYVLPITQMFENDVKMYGTQTRITTRSRLKCLRMM